MNKPKMDLLKNCLVFRKLNLCGYDIEIILSNDMNTLSHEDICTNMRPKYEISTQPYVDVRCKSSLPIASGYKDKYPTIMLSMLKRDMSGL